MASFWVRFYTSFFRTTPLTATLFEVLAAFIAFHCTLFQKNMRIVLYESTYVPCKWMLYK